MKTMPSCVLYSRDEELAGRLIRLASSLAAVQPIAEQEDLKQWLAQFGDTVLLADLRAPNCLDVLSALRHEKPATIVIPLGAERSDPMLAAETLEPFATLSLEPDRRAFQTLLKQAVECLALRQKTKVLEDELATLTARNVERRPEPRALFSAPRLCRVATKKPGTRCGRFSNRLRPSPTRAPALPAAEPAPLATL